MPISSPALEHFRAVRDGLRPPHFLQTARLGEASDAGSSLLDCKIRRARELYSSCDVCPHDCHVNRNVGEVGYCGVAAESAVHWEGILHGEEIELVPSHEVFFSGCTMRCAFCYSYEHIMRPMSGVLQSPIQLAAAARTRFEQGATNWNVVGGDPTVHLLTILQTLRELAKTQTPLPVVWNSNMYIAPHAMEILHGVVDLYLGDIHFGNNDCARRLGRIPKYFETVTVALETAVQSGASVIIRHLAMPGHGECCARPAMEWATRILPEIPFHLMFQYVPDFRARSDAQLGRPLTPEEIREVQTMATEIGVNRYQETAGQQLLEDAPPQRGERGGQDLTVTQVADSTELQHSQPEPASIGDSVDVLIHPDGRIVFTRLTEELLPVANVLNENDVRLKKRR